MSQQVFLDYLRSFTLSFTPKTIEAIRKLLDPFNFKYKRPFNIISPEDNPQEYNNKTPLTQRVLQLSLAKMCLDLMDEKHNKSYMFGTFCQFLSDNFREIINASSNKDKKDNGMMKMVVYLLWRMVKQWCSKTYSIQVIKNQPQLQRILLIFKSFLQDFVNKEYIKSESDKLGIFSTALTPIQIPFSPSSMIINPTFTQQSLNSLPQLPSRLSLYNEHENSPVQLQVQFTSTYTMPQLYLSTYSLMIFMYYYNDQSMLYRESSSIVNSKKSQIFMSLITQNSPKKQTANYDHQQQHFSQQSIYFSKQHYLSLLSQSLQILFHLSTGGKELQMLTEMFAMCSHLFVFKQNSQKPTVLRLVLYGQKKMRKETSWVHMFVKKQQYQRYLKLIYNYLMLDPKFRHRLLGLIDEWLEMGVDLMNESLMQHWKVLIDIVNKRIFEGLLEGQMFNLMISKSQGNKHCRSHMGYLLSEMIQHVSIEIAIKNSQQIFCLQEFLHEKKVKLLEIYFQCIKRVLERKKNVSNKTMVNRVVSLYLELKEETKIKKMEFVEFFRLLVQNSVQSGEKLFTQKNLKSIHVPQQTCTNLMLSNSQKFLGNSRRLTEQHVDLSQTTKNPLSLTSSSKFIFTSNIMKMQQLGNDEQVLQQLQDVQIIMLHQLLEQRKKGESYFLKFMKEINKSYFSEDNIKVYEIYSQYLVNKLTDYSLTVPEFNKSIQMTCTPQSFQRYSALYETLFTVANDKKILSLKLYKSMLLLEAVTEKDKLSENHHWFVRKLKYFFTQTYQQSIRSRMVSMGASDIPRLDMSLELSRKTSVQASQSRIQINDKLCTLLFDYIKSLFMKLKNKVTFLALISMFCLRYCQTHRKIINMEKKQQNKRKSTTQHQLASQLGEISDFLQANNYALILSTCSMSTSILFVLYNLVLMNEYVTHSGIKSNLFQSGGRIKQFDHADFLQIDENPLLVEIRRILVLMIDSFTPYQINEFLYMFTMKESLGEKLLTYLGLPSFESIPLISRIQPIVKIIREITTRKYLSLQKRQILLPFYNHIEFSFFTIPKSQFSMMKNDQKTYKISIEMLINWSIKCDNFISFWTDKGKYKLIIKQKQFSQLYRKDGSNQTQKIEDYDIKTQIMEKLTIQVSIKSNEMSVYLQKKKLIANISCDSQILGIKLQMINGLLVEKVSIAKTSPQIDFHQRPQLIPIELNKSFIKQVQMQMQIKLKEISTVDNQAAWMNFPYQKYYFLLKKLIKFNNELAEHKGYQFLSNVLTQTYLKMLQNKALTTSTFITSSKLLSLNNNNSSSIIQIKRDSQIFTSNTVKPEEIWKTLTKRMTDIFIEIKNQPNQRKKSQNALKMQRKFSQDTTLMKLNLIRTNSSKSKPQNQDEDFMFGRGSTSTLEIFSFVEIPKLPDLKKSSKIICTNGFVFYLQEVILRKDMWEYWQEKEKLQVSIFLRDLFSNKDFLVQIENETFDIFYHFLNVFEKVSENQSIPLSHMYESKENFNQPPQSPLSTSTQSPKAIIIKNLSLCLKQILLTHQLSDLLRDKYRYLFYIGETGRSKLVKQLFLSILDKLSCSLYLNDSSTNAKMSRWLIIESQRFQYVFGKCRQQTRVRILDYLSEISLEEQQNALIKFMQKLSLQMVYEVRMWVMIYIKKLLFKLKMKQNVLKLMKHLGQILGLLLKVSQDIKDKAQKELKDKMQKETEKQELLKIVQQSIIYLNKRQQANQPISRQLQLVLMNEDFIRYFQYLITQNVLTPTMNSNCSVNKLCSIIFNSIFALQKKLLLKALTRYRKLANKIIPLLIYPLKLQVSRKLSVYQLSCFLQYILEATLSVQNSIGAQQKSYFVISVKAYLQWLVKNYHSQKQQFTGALVYVYPKLYHILNCHSKKELQTKLRAISSVDVMELRGGIYFKLIAIVIHLIQMKPDEDFSMLVEVIMFRPLDQRELKDQRQLQAAFKAMNDFSQVQSSSRQRTFVEKLMNQFSSSHKLYSSQYDKPLQPLQVVSNKLVKFQQENDLTLYCIDYLLMRLIQYLSQSFNATYDSNTQEIKRKYSNLIFLALDKFPLISNDLTEKNIDSNIPVHDYSSLVQLLTAGEQELLVGQKLTTPKSRYDFEVETPTTPQKDYIDQSYLQKLHTPSKSMKNIELYENQRFYKTAGKRDELFLNVTAQPRKRKKSNTYFITNQSTKIRDTMLDLIKKDHKKWNIECRQKRFSQFFRDQAKQLLVIELMFTFYVESSVLKPPMSTISQKQARMLQKYFQTIEQHIQQYEQSVAKPEWSGKQLTRMFNIKRLSPYLLESPPILKVKASAFPNMCMPIMTQIPKPSYRLRQIDPMKKINNFQSISMDQQQFTMDMFGIDSQNEQTDFIIEDKQDKISIKDNLDDELDIGHNIALTPKKSFYSGSQKSARQKSYVCLQQSDDQQNMQKKKKQQTYCELVTRKGVYFCQWRIEMRQNNQKNHKNQKQRTNNTKKKLQPILLLQTFKHKPQQCPRQMKYGSPLSNLLSFEKQIQIPLKLIREIFLRKFNQIRNNSIELFCSDGRQHFICLYSIDRAEALVQQIFQKTKSIMKINIIRQPQKQFQTKEYTNKWANGQIDNFTYLMLVNKYSGRSFCDTNQYPVFPWVVRDYRSSELDLNNIKTYRDLTKPIGALNEDKLKKYYEKYYLQNQDTGIFLYGSHFSTSLFVYYFLVRMEPFSSLHQQMQGGSWDAPDRLFSSMEHMWDSLMSASSATDIKESIPQFYYFPFFLKNTNHIDLGIRQSGQQVHDVLLPPWAKSPQDFVYKMRLAFESNYVSLNIPYWIDLIFGIDQKNIKRHNLFHPLSYAQNIHVEKIAQRDLQARMCQISYFGQFPIKLFTKAHKMKKLSVSKIFNRDILTTGFIRSSSSGKKQTEDVVMLSLPTIFSIASISKKSRFQNTPSCILKVKNNQINVELQIEIDPKMQGVQNIIKKLTALSKDSEKSNRKRQASFMMKQKQQSSMKKFKDPFYNGYSEPRMCTIFSKVTKNLLTFYSASNPNLILSSYWFQSRYSSHLYNQSFVILYGQDGLCILNWNFQEIYSYSKKAVDCCFVDEFLVFIATKEGRVYLYDIVSKNLTNIVDLSLVQEDIRKKEKQSKVEKQTKAEKEKPKEKQKQLKMQKIYSTKMKVFFDKKLISSSLQEQYKIILIANDNRIFIVNYRYLKRNWVNVEKD